jgi:hypothetical protein
MHTRSLLCVVVASSAFGCASTPNDPAAQSRPDEPIRTGTRLPSNNSGMTGTISKDDYQNQRSRSGSAGDLFK